MMKLAPLETEVIDLFVHLARLVSIPKSVAEIYGLLFVATRPFSMDDIIDRLNLSKGSASQGLKLLRGLGAVRTVYVPGKRNDHFLAEMELRRLLRGLLKDKLEPHFHNGADRLRRIQSLFHQLPPVEQDQLGPRVDKLRNWQESGIQFLPLVEKFLH